MPAHQVVGRHFLTPLHSTLAGQTAARSRAPHGAAIQTPDSPDPQILGGTGSRIAVGGFIGFQSGHDTSYSPDGDDVNPRKDYTYNDAHEAVDQPTLRPVALVGFSYRLGR